MKNSRKKKQLERVRAVDRALSRLGFIDKIEERRIGGRVEEVWTQHNESHLSANLVDTGFGASQVLPVIISLYTASENSVLLYEQPEIHLHPAAQAELGSVFVDARSRTKRIVVETHSENLILRMQTEVAEGRLSPGDIAIYYVRPQRGGHDIIQIPLNEKGEFLAEWPKGFFEESYNESLKLSRARKGGH